MTRYWIGVVSKSHVERGVSGGFCQLGHGKAAPLKRMAQGDWLIYYSPKLELSGDSPYQHFTAIGQLTDSEPYAFKMAEDFIPYRRNVSYQAASDAPIKPLIARLGFIKNPARWGYAFRYGHFEINVDDFELIATAMNVRPPQRH